MSVTENGVVGADLIQSISLVSSLDWATILLHEAGSDEANETSLGGVTLGVSLDVSTAALLSDHSLASFLEDDLLAGVHVAEVLREADGGLLLLLAVTVVPSTDFLILGVELEESRRGKS